MSDVQSISGAGTAFSIDSGTSLQFMYAQLQLFQSQAMKTQAMGIMHQIENTQEEQKKVADMIAKARDYQEKVKTSGNNTKMPQELVDFFNDPNRKLPLQNSSGSKDEWEFNIKSLTNYQDQLGTDTQTKMVYLQDYISQYNSYLQGASTQISNAADTQKTILRNS